MQLAPVNPMKNQPVEAYNHHEQAVILTSNHPEAYKHEFQTLRVRIQPREHKALQHLYYEIAFEDGSPVPNVPGRGQLTMNFGKAKGKGITSPSQYKHSDHVSR